VRPEITTDKYPAYSEYRPFSSFFVLCCVTCVALCRCKHCVPKRLVVFGGRCDSPGGNAARSGAERWFGCLGHSLDSCFLPIVELGWVDPVCGQQAVDLGFRSGRRSPWRERERESNPKDGTLPTPPLARGGANFLTAGSRRWRKGIAGRSRTRRMAPCAARRRCAR
jgi:hypothetical protein